MKQSNRFINDMLDLEKPENAEDILFRAMRPAAVRESGGAAVLDIPFRAQKRGSFETDSNIPDKVYSIYVKAYGDSILRITADFDGCAPGDGSVMLEFDPALKPEPLSVHKTQDGWTITDSAGNTRMKIYDRELRHSSWSDPFEAFDAEVLPDGRTSIPISAHDQFYTAQVESVGLGCIERDGRPARSIFSLYAAHNEKFAGTGERFAGMNLAGRTLTLENVDALGVNNRRAYKNIPFYVSSRPYGAFIHTSAHVRLSLADISTRAAQGIVEDGNLDLFLIGGGSVERVVYNYRRLTGFPKLPPLWSYGTWMSRMTYLSAAETEEVVDRLRREGFPCDVIHLDTGWFRTDWQCEWEFSSERFPDPAGYMRKMREKGIHITLWQLPRVAKNTLHFETARDNRYIVPKKPAAAGGSNFGNVEYGGDIDFTNPKAVKWYQDLLERLLKMGASGIKTDFGEEIDSEGEYYGMPYKRLHNLYSLLYQKAAFEITEKVTGEGIIWARSGWAGSQRYPLHWGGDSACTWDGLAGTIRGGLHFGVSGFAFWSHDVGGFHGIPNFMLDRPAEDLYVRWTQVGVLSSHIRYHGTTPREPYEYPSAAPVVRKWLKLRYALIPYLTDQAEKAVASGYPVLRSLIFQHGDDPMCWSIDDQFYCGDALLAAPVLNSEGLRDVYLPAGSWVDVWTGEAVNGPVTVKDIVSPLSRIPLYARRNAVIRVYPYEVLCTDEMDLSKAVELKFDDTYKGLSSSVLGRVTGLE